MEVLAVGGGDAERLLHKPIRLVSVALGLAIVLVLVATAARLGRLAGSSLSVGKTTSPLALHLAVGQEAS